MKIVAISDAHGKWNKVVIPECDLLISAGDYSFNGEDHMVRDFHKWMNKQPAKHKISVQGNHEKRVESNFILSKQMAEEACPGVHFIDEGPIDIENIKIWCSAITPFFFNWAWNRHPGQEIQKHWDRIPNNIDILVTHGPVYGLLDGVPYFDQTSGEMSIRHCGCKQLFNKTMMIAPKVHVCGHIHEGYGETVFGNTKFINASICDAEYRPVNKPIVFEI